MSRKRMDTIQAAFNNSGNQIAVDGVRRRKTTSVLKDFEQKYGMKPTGHADQVTPQQLKVGACKLSAPRACSSDLERPKSPSRSFLRVMYANGHARHARNRPS